MAQDFESIAILKQTQMFVFYRTTCMTGEVVDVLSFECYTHLHYPEKYAVVGSVSNNS